MYIILHVYGKQGLIIISHVITPILITRFDYSHMITPILITRFDYSHVITPILITRFDYSHVITPILITRFDYSHVITPILMLVIQILSKTEGLTIYEIFMFVDRFDIVWIIMCFYFHIYRPYRRRTNISSSY